jgi:hypothetical protein
MILMANAVFAADVKTDFSKSTNFAAYKTFMWIKEPTIADSLVRERVMREINAALTARGLRLVAAEADLCIAAHIATKGERTLDAFYDGYGDWRWVGGFGAAPTTTTMYDSGTLLVDLFDGNSKEAIWRGTSSKAFSGDPQKNAKDLNEAVVKMFKDFPPATKAKPGVLAWMAACLLKGFLGAGAR